MARLPLDFKIDTRIPDEHAFIISIPHTTNYNDEPIVLILGYYCNTTLLESDRAHDRVWIKVVNNYDYQEVLTFAEMLCDIKQPSRGREGK